MANYEKTRTKAEKKAKKKVKKVAKQALKGKKGKDVTDVVKTRDKEQSKLAGVFNPRIVITGPYKAGK